MAKQLKGGYLLRYKSKSLVSFLRLYEVETIGEVVQL